MTTKPGPPSGDGKKGSSNELLSSFWAPDASRWGRTPARYTPGGNISSNDDEIKIENMTNVLRAQMSLVHAISSILSVEWSVNDEPMCWGASPVMNESTQDFRLIRVHPFPLLDRERLGPDIVSGFSLHAAAHIRYARYRYVAGRGKIAFTFEPLTARSRVITKRGLYGSVEQINALLNLISAAVEEIAIERALGRDFPGFLGYLQRSSTYIWSKIQTKPGAPLAPGLVNPLERLTWIARGFQVPNYTHEEGITYHIFEHAVAAPTLEWRTRWSLLLARRLGLELPEPMSAISGGSGDDSDQSDDEGEGEDKSSGGNNSDGKNSNDDTDEKIKEMADRSEMVNKDIRSMLPELSKDTKKQLQNMLKVYKTSANMKLASTTNNMTKDAVSNTKVVIPDDPRLPRSFQIVVRDHSLSTSLKPFNWPANRAAQLAETLRTLEKNQITLEDHLRRGKLDDKRLIDLAVFKENDVFNQINFERSSIAAALLVDESGSMYSAIEYARQAAALFVNALEFNPENKTWVFGHTADEDGIDAVTIMPYISPEQHHINRLSTMRGRSNNIDGIAINWVGEFLLNEPLSDGREKWLILFADGLPHGSNYSGAPAIEHVRRVVERLESRGIKFFCLGFGSLREDWMKQMYGNRWRLVGDATKLPEAMASLLINRVRG